MVRREKDPRGVAMGGNAMDSVERDSGGWERGASSQG